MMDVDLDLELAIGGILNIALAAEVFTKNPTLSALGFLGGFYLLWKAFYTIDPSGV